MSSEGMKQLHFAFIIELPPQARDVHLDYIAELLPVKIVEMLQELALRDDLPDT